MLTGNTTTTLTVEWALPTSTYTGFQIGYSIDGGTETLSAVLSALTDSYTITNLEPGEEYTVSLYLVNNNEVENLAGGVFQTSKFAKYMHF